MPAASGAPRQLSLGRAAGMVKLGWQLCSDHLIWDRSVQTSGLSCLSADDSAVLGLSSSISKPQIMYQRKITQGGKSQILNAAHSSGALRVLVKP